MKVFHIPTCILSVALRLHGKAILKITFYVPNFILGFTFLPQTKYFNSKDSMIIDPAHFDPSQGQM